MSEPAKPSPATIPAVFVPMGMASEEKTRVSNDAEKSWLLGILSFFCCTLFISPYAIFLGLRAKKEIKANPNEVTGNCKANSGIATASIALILWCVLIILIVVYKLSYKEEMDMYGN